MPEIKTVEIIHIYPTRIWIENDFLGGRHVVLQHEGMHAFTYATFGYDYAYTSNQGTWDAAQRLALQLGATEPVEVRQRPFVMPDDEDIAIARAFSNNVRLTQALSALYEDALKVRAAMQSEVGCTMVDDAALALADKALKEMSAGERVPTGQSPDQKLPAAPHTGDLGLLSDIGRWCQVYAQAEASLNAGVNVHGALAEMVAAADALRHALAQKDGAPVHVDGGPPAQGAEPKKSE